MEIVGATEPPREPSAAERGESRTASQDRKTELTVDEVLEEHVGSLGISQILHALIVSIAWIFDAQTTLISIFTDAQPAARLLKGGVVADESSELCRMPPATWEWVGGRTTSVVAEWNLICDHKFLAAVPASLFFIGSMCGSGIYGYLADSWPGRKKTLLISCFLTSFTALAISFSPNIWVYIFLRFANGFFRSGIGSCCLVLATEVSGRKWRGQVGQYGFFFFTSGFLSLPLIAFLKRNSWRAMYRIISVFPLFYALFLLPFAWESPRWLLVKGRNEEAIDVLKKLAKLNGKHLPADLSLINPIPRSDRARSEKMEKIWKTRWAAKRMMTVMFAGFGVGFVYYGIQLNAENLHLNLYLTVALNAATEIPAVFIGSILLVVMNRRPLFSRSNYLAGIACLICAVLSIEHLKLKGASVKWVMLIVEAVGFMASSTAFDVLSVYSVELFPTNVRNLAVSMLRQSMMLGASVAPLLVAVGRMSPLVTFVVFGVVSGLSGVLTMWLQETRNAPLYETLKQQDMEEKKQDRT